MQLDSWKTRGSSSKLIFLAQYLFNEQYLNSYRGLETVLMTEVTKLRLKKSNLLEETEKNKPSVREQ